MDISKNPLAEPKKNNAMASVTKLVAIRGKTAEIQRSIIPIQVALPTPKRLMILEATGNTVKTPKDRKNKAIPKVALSIPRSSLTVGM
jgi:hypothetical protein